MANALPTRASHVATVTLASVGVWTRALLTAHVALLSTALALEFALQRKAVIDVFVEHCSAWE